MKQETIVFGGGCFWCTEAIFKMLKGVISIEPGYAGGPKVGGPERSEGQGGPTYEEVCGGNTGHAEVVQIEYDSEIISLENLLTIFFATHDPTTKNRPASPELQRGEQGNDVGEQYRSIILYSTDEQKAVCEKFIADFNASSQMGAPIVITVEPLKVFYPAEEYHKNYYENNKNKAYCQVVINPKLNKVKEKFGELLK